MRSAPSVSYPVGRSRFCAGLLAGLWVAGLAAGLAWLIPGPVEAWRTVAWTTVLAGCAVWGWRWYAGQVGGQLNWDGTAWRWRESGADHAIGPDESGRQLSLAVALDLQRVLLVRCVAGGRGPSRWLWLQAGDDVAQWRALRRAVYSRAPPEPSVHTQSGATHP